MAIKFYHFSPKTLDKALSLLQEHEPEAKVIAGGVDLITSMKNGLIAPKALVNLKSVTGLDEIKDKVEGLKIGPLVTLDQLKKSPIIVKRYSILSEAIEKIAVVPIQNMATLGGNICMETRCLFYNHSAFWRKERPGCFKLGGRVCHVRPGSDHCHAVYQGDCAPILMALGATVKVAGGSKERKLPLKDFFTGRGEKPNILNPQEILIEIEIPSFSSRLVGGYEKFSIRGAMDFPLAGVAMTVSSDRTRIVLNGIHSFPIEIDGGSFDLQRKKDKVIIAQVLKEAMDKIHPVPNTDSSPEHRKKMVGVLLERLLRGL